MAYQPGHEHEGIDEILADWVFVCPGSSSEPRSSSAERDCFAALLDFGFLDWVGWDSASSSSAEM